MICMSRYRVEAMHGTNAIQAGGIGPEYTTAQRFGRRQWKHSEEEGRLSDTGWKSQ
jgi:hypothetical protein